MFSPVCLSRESSGSSSERREQSAAAPKTAKPPARWRAKLGQVFSIDLRSLALFRMALALVLIADTGVALTNAEAFYSDAGVLPRPVLYEQVWADQTYWSLHALSGSVSWQVGLMTLQMVAAVCLLAGYRTRLATVLGWLLFSSLDARNPLVSNGADSMIRLLLFWSIFLPLGAWWSLDAWRRRKAGGLGSATPASTLVSFPGACLLLQVAFVYWFSVLFKNHAVWWSEGTALRQTLELDAFARPAAVWLRQYPDLCRLLTHGTVFMEIAGPLLALLPILQGRLRLAMAGAFLLFHLGIYVCMDIGSFPWVMMSAWLAFIPAVFWNRVAAWRKKQVIATPQESPAVVTGLPATRWRWAVQGFCAVCLAMVFMWNLRGTNFTFWEKVFPRSANPVVMGLRLDQYWTMFAPTPLLEDGWFILRGGMSDGSEVDLLREGAPVDWRKPELLSATFKDSRWQKYLMNLWMMVHQQHRGPYGDYMVRRWNETHGGMSQVVAWQLWFVREETQPDGTAGRPQPFLMHERERVPAQPEAAGEQLVSPSP